MGVHECVCVCGYTYEMLCKMCINSSHWVYLYFPLQLQINVKLSVEKLNL
uniref:Uncharacterized protein n=1 Tax=Anguilla anguilla TaxID=7936 RepID=A0A0E9QI46_ANGAN